MRSTVRWTDRRGLSLGEVVLSLAILSVAYLALIQLYQLTLAQTLQSRDQVVAQQLATNFFELYRVQLPRVREGLKGEKVRTNEDVLANKEIRDLLTRGMKEIEDVIAAARFKMKVEVELGVGNRLRLDRVEIAIQWQEGGRTRGSTHARLILL